MPRIFDTGTIKSALEESNRDYYGQKTWENLYGQVGLSAAKAREETALDYYNAVSEAYASAYGQSKAIQQSNLGQGYKNAYLQDTNQALLDAYESYRKNYMENKSAIATNEQSAIQAISKAATSEAENTAALAGSAFDYLSDLYDRYSKGEAASNIFLTDPRWSRYTERTPILDETTGEQLTDTEGNLMYDTRLKTKDELSRDLFDDEGYLTVAGADFYDQMFNLMAYEMPSDSNALSYSEWLYEKNPDLYNWASAYNPYNYTEADTNFGSFKTMVGLTSKDYKYQFIERFGGMNEEQITKMFDQYVSKFEVPEENKTKNIESFIGNVNTSLTEVKTLMDKLGVTEDFAREVGGWDNLTTMITEQLQKLGNPEEYIDTKKYKNLVGELAGVVTATGGGAGLGGVMGGPIGAIVGGIIGLIVGVSVVGAAHVRNAKQREAETDALLNDAKAQTKQLYTDLITAITNYGMSKRRDAEIAFADKNNRLF